MHFDNGAADGAIDTSFFDCRNDVKNDSSPGHPCTHCLEAGFFKTAKSIFFFGAFFFLVAFMGSKKDYEWNSCQVCHFNSRTTKGLMSSLVFCEAKKIINGELVPSLFLKSDRISN